MNEKEDPLAFLLRLNLELADKEAKGQPITPPGLAVPGKQAGEITSSDCVGCE
jgi:hypothetical protein